MKKISGLIILSFISFSIVQAQTGKFSFNAHGGYTFTDRVNFDAGHTDIKDGFQYGAGLEFFTSSRTSVELLYSRQDTRFPLYLPAGEALDGDDKGSMNFILLNGYSYFPKSSGAKNVPFIGGGAGVGVVNFNGHSSVNFAWDVKTGVSLNHDKPLNIKLQAYVNSMIGAFGSDFWRVPGGIAVVEDYATTLQFGLGAVISFNRPPGGKK